MEWNGVQWNEPVVWKGWRWVMGFFLKVPALLVHRGWRRVDGMNNACMVLGFVPIVLCTLYFSLGSIGMMGFHYVQ